MLGLLSSVLTTATASSIAGSAVAIVGGVARLAAGAVIAKVGTDMARPVVEKVINGVVGAVTNR